MVELVKTLSVDQHILPQLLKQREKYSGRLCEEGYDTAALKKELDVRIVGQERDNSILVAWNDASPTGTAGHRVTYFGLFEHTQHQLRLLFIHDKKVVVTGASVNQERHLLAFTITEPYFASVDDPSNLNIPGIYKSFLAEIRPQNRIFSLYIERHMYQRVQFLYGEYHGYGSASKRESHMLFLHHQEAIGLYHIPMARFADKGMIISDQPRTEQVADKFIWAQWDSQQQQLFLVYPKYKDADAEANEREGEAVFMFAAYQFNEKTSHVRVLNFPLPFPDVNLSVKTSYPQYLDMALAQTVSERHVNIQVVTLPGRGSFFICLQHPIPGQTEESSHQKAERCSSAVSYHMEYSVYAFHHGCIMNCVLPRLHHFKHVENSRLFFSSLNEYLMVLLPGHVLHLLDCSSMHEPCHHIILQGDAIPKLPSRDASCKEPPLLLYLNKEVGTSLQTGPYIFDSSSGDAYKYNFDKTALSELFARTHMPSTRLAILHLAVIHVRDSSLITKIFEHLSRDPASPECLHLLREYLVGATYGKFQRQLEKEAVKLIPFTCVDTFRGHLEKDINRKRIAQISCSFVRDNPIEFQNVKSDKKKQADFWTALLQNTKRPPPRLQLRASPVVENNDQVGDSGDEAESAPSPGLVASLYRKLHISARKLSGSNESIGSQESNKNISKDFLDSTEEERSVSEIKKQNTTIDRLAIHLQNHLPRETRVKVQNIAIEYLKFQAYQSETLLRLLFQALRFTDNPFSELLSLPCTTRDAVFFQLIERYYTAVTELSFPFPTGFRTSMTILGFRCLDRRMFLQYVDHDVLLLKSGFITRLLEDFAGEGENEDYVFQIICRLKHASAKNALRHWEHPVATRYVSQQLVDDVLTNGVGGVRESPEHSYAAWRENVENSSVSSETWFDDSQTFRPLATLMATLRSDAQQSTRCVNETEFNFIEERALLETQRETVGSLGTIPF